MMPSGTSAPGSGSQSVPPSQPAFPSLVSPRSQFSNMNMLGNAPNVSSFLNQSFGNGDPPNSVLHGPGNNQHGGAHMGVESDSISNLGFNGSPSMVNPSLSGQVQNQQFSNSSVFREQQQSQQIDPQSFQPGQQQFQSVRGGLAGVGPVKMEPQVMNDQQGPQQAQHLQSLRNLGPVKLEPQQIQTMKSLGSVKVEPQQHSDPSLFLQQQRQQQQLLRMSQQSSHTSVAQMNLLQQQRLMQLQQQQQQQQLLKAMPQQRPQLPQQFQQQNLHLRPPMKPLYEPGTCARRLTQYMCQQQHRPEDNNIEFWRRFVAEYFAPNARKKWCVSLYGSGRQTTGVFPQDVWQCEICNRKPGRGFEATAEVLPRLFKIKYESGTLEELLYVDMPHEYQNSSGQIVLDYAKAIQESVFEQLRVVRDGQLRIVFSPDLKICSWEFCARRHEELIPRRLLIPQVGQLGAAAQKYQQATQEASSNLSVQELQNSCNAFVASARHLAKALEVPLVNDLGYTKRYVRCLQISEVVNSMKDLIDHSRTTRTGPIESLAKFPRRTNGSCAQGRGQQPEEQQQQQQPQSMTQNSNNDQRAVQGASPLQLSGSNGVANANAFNPASASPTASAISGLLHHNSMNGRQNAANNPSSPYGGNSVQMPSPTTSSSTIPQTQQNPSPFQSPTASSNNNNTNNHLPQQSQSGLDSGNHMSVANSLANMSAQQMGPSIEADLSDSQSSVQKILHNMMMNTPINGTADMFGTGSLGNDVKNLNGMLPGNNNVVLGTGNTLVGNGPVNHNLGITGSGFGMMGGGGFGQSANMNGIRAVLGNNNSNPAVNGRTGMAGMAQNQIMSHQQQDLSNQLLNGLGAVNGFNNLQFDWKPSP